MPSLVKPITYRLNSAIRKLALCTRAVRSAKTPHARSGPFRDVAERRELQRWSARPCH